AVATTPIGWRWGLETEVIVPPQEFHPLPLSGGTCGRARKAYRQRYSYSAPCSSIVRYSSPPVLSCISRAARMNARFPSESLLLNVSIGLPQQAKSRTDGA